MFKQITAFPLWLKVVMVIVILTGAGITWWLASPLFLPGKNLDDVTIEDYTVLLEGNLVYIDSAHHGDGLVQIVNDSVGDLYVLFTDIEIANGPSLFVYLSDKSSFSGTRDTPGNYLDLGALPATTGTYNMKIPANANIDNYMSVLIWCDPFSVVFTYATLTAAQIVILT